MQKFIEKTKKGFNQKTVVKTRCQNYPINKIFNFFITIVIIIYYSPLNYCHQLCYYFK